MAAGGGAASAARRAVGGRPAPCCPASRSPPGSGKRPAAPTPAASPRSGGCSVVTGFAPWAATAPTSQVACPRTGSPERGCGGRERGKGSKVVARLAPAAQPRAQQATARAGPGMARSLRAQTHNTFSCGQESGSGSGPVRLLPNRVRSARLGKEPGAPQAGGTVPAGHEREAPSWACPASPSGACSTPRHATMQEQQLLGPT